MIKIDKNSTEINGVEYELADFQVHEIFMLSMEQRLEMQLQGVHNVDLEEILANNLDEIIEC